MPVIILRLNVMSRFLCSALKSHSDEFGSNRIYCVKRTLTDFWKLKAFHGLDCQISLENEFLNAKYRDFILKAFRKFDRGSRGRLQSHNPRA